MTDTPTTLDAGALEVARRAYMDHPSSTQFLDVGGFEAAITAYLAALRPAPAVEAETHAKRIDEKPLEDRLAILRESVTPDPQASAVDGETFYRDELWKVADLVERHWKGAGLKLEAEWIMQAIVEMAHRKDDESDRADTAEAAITAARLAALEEAAEIATERDRDDYLVWPDGVEIARAIRARIDQHKAAQPGAGETP